jgi:hypothetical protein
MKILILLITTILGNFALLAQREIVPTDSIKVFGKIKEAKTFSLAELDTFSKIAIPEQIIYNHKGEIKDTLKIMKGIPLKKLLSSIEFVYDKPKALNEFYFIFTATDNYKVVFSWNEIYNTDSGNNFFIITEMGGKKLKDLDQRIYFVSAADLKSGRRYIKGLEKIEVKQLE